MRDGLGRVDYPVDDFEGERVGPLDEFECERGDGRSGAVFDGQGYAIVAITPEIEVELPQAWNSDEPRRAWPARMLPAPLRA